MSNAAQQLSENLASVVEAQGPSVVRIEGGRGIPSSGIAWSKDLVVTVAHALEREEELKVGLSDGTVLDATVVGRDPATDVAVLRVKEPKLTPAKFVELDGLKVGHLLLGLGRPGKSTRAALGMASAIGSEEWRTHGGGKLERYVQLDIGRYPGFSGGAIVGLDGGVVGMSTAGLTRGYVLAIPKATLGRVVDSLVAHGQVKRGFLGVGIFPVRLPAPVAQQVGQETGALVISVQPGSAAEQAGIVLGDVLVSLDGKSVTQPADLLSLLDEERVGQQSKAKILRAGALQELPITIGTRS